MANQINVIDQPKSYSYSGTRTWYQMLLMGLLTQKTGSTHSPVKVYRRMVLIHCSTPDCVGSLMIPVHHSNLPLPHYTNTALSLVIVTPSVSLHAEPFITTAYVRTTQTTRCAQLGIHSSWTHYELPVEMLLKWKQINDLQLPGLP